MLRSLFREREAFATVDDAALAQLESRMRPRRCRNGDVICEEDDPGGWIFFVVAGQVEVFKRARDGAMIQVNVLQPGDWGGLMSIASEMPRSARLLARGNVELRVLGFGDLAELVEETPCLAMGLLACMSRRLGEDAIHLAATLRYVSVAGLEEVYEHCAPQERLMLDTIRHRADAAESLEEIMNFVFDAMHHISDCDRLTLAFLEDGGSRVVSHWSRATYEPLLLPANYAEDLAGSSLEDTRQTGRPHVINDLEAYARQNPRRRVPRRMVEEGLRSSVAAPLVVGGRTVGFLIRGGRRKNAFDDHQVRLHQAIVSSINQPVEKAYRIDQLTRANNDYAEVLGFVSHELQSPIASMVTDAQLLADGYLGPLNERQRDKLRRSIRKGQYLLNLVRDLLNLARLEDPSLKAEMQQQVDLWAAVVAPAIDLIESDRAARNMTLERHCPEPLPAVECDTALMQIACGNLLKNAVKYGRDRGTIRVTAEAEADHVRLAVWNEGPGFSAEQRPRLFRKFSRLTDPALHKKTGTGVGLYSAWRIMQLHRGRVTAHSEQGAWAEFSLFLPLRQEQPNGS